MVDDGAVATRNDAKLGLLGAIDGATRGESCPMVAGLTRRYPAAFGLVEEAARAGERGEAVRTLLGRGSPTLGESWARDPSGPPVDPEVQSRHRRTFGRFTRNFVVQGTGAEWALCWIADLRSEEHTSELQSLMRISYAVFCLKKKNKKEYTTTH